MPDVISRQKDLGPLHDLLLKACPADNDGRRSISILADRIGVSTNALYTCIRNNHISPRLVGLILGVADDRVSTRDFDPYVYGS